MPSVSGKAPVSPTSATTNTMGRLRSIYPKAKAEYVPPPSKEFRSGVNPCEGDNKSSSGSGKTQLHPSKRVTQPVVPPRRPVQRASVPNFSAHEISTTDDEIVQMLKTPTKDRVRKGGLLPVNARNSAPSLPFSAKPGSKNLVKKLSVGSLKKPLRTSESESDVVMQGSNSARTFPVNYQKVMDESIQMQNDQDVSSVSDLASVASHATSSNIPAVSDSYIDRNDYVTKPRWGLNSSEVIRVDEKDNKEFPSAKIPHTLNIFPTVWSNSESKSASGQSLTKMSQLGDELFPTNRQENVSRILASSLGSKMESLSMEKVFNDPSFHGIYERYSQCKKRGSVGTDSVIEQFDSVIDQLSEAETTPRANCRTSSKTNIQTAAPYQGTSSEFGFAEENAYTRAVREQIPDQLALLGREMLNILTEDVVSKNSLMRKLRDASFPKRTDNTLECLSVFDLGLEKADHQFITETWGHVNQLTESCRQIYQILCASRSPKSTFVKNILSVISHSTDQGLDLASALIKIATFVVGRDGASDDLFCHVANVRQLTESLVNNNKFLIHVKEILAENFSAIHLVGKRANSEHFFPESLG